MEVLISPEMKPEKYTAWLLFIILLGTGLRLYHLDYQSLWLDEIYSMIGSNPDQSFASMIAYCRNDQPPAFFTLLYYWFKAFGYTPYAGRLLAAIIGVIGIVFVYFLGKEVRDKETGLFAALIAAFNYFQIYYSQEVRFYSLLFLLATLSYLFFIRIIKWDKGSDYFLYVIFTTLAMYTHYYGLVILASQGLEAQASTPADLAKRLKEDIGLYAKVLKDAGVKPE